MEICRTIAEVRRAVREARGTGRTIGAVPTMGALHAGHASLIDAAVRNRHFVVVTIFVNPTQFGPAEDFASYPRTLDADCAMCEAHGTDAVFAPSIEQMYAPDAATKVSVSGLTEGLCGHSRPGHFDGVCTVVAKLFNIILPDAAYFGQKDAQQAAVIRQMAADLDFPLEVVVCPTIREEDGLALSSRNAYLTAGERAQAPAMFEALKLANEKILSGERDAAALRAAILTHLSLGAPLGRADYVEIVNPQTLRAVETISDRVLIALAVRFPSARLIDNLVVDVPAGKP